MFDRYSILGSIIGSSFPFEKGQAWTFLPKDVPKERLYSFSAPELLPINTQRRNFRTEPVIEIATLSKDYAAYLAKTLNHHGENAFCILEDPLLKPGEGSIPEALNSFSIGGTLYYFITRQTDRNLLYYALNACTTPWRGLGVICTPNASVPLSMLSCLSKFELYLRSAIEVFTVAYDGESYVTVTLPKLHTGTLIVQ